MSHDAWVRLRKDMAGAGFPVAEQLGLYRAQGWLAPLWVYQVRLGKDNQPAFRPRAPPAASVKGCLDTVQASCDRAACCSWKESHTAWYVLSRSRVSHPPSG